jgi:hypothetical protein
MVAALIICPRESPSGARWFLPTATQPVITDEFRICQQANGRK